MSTLDLSRPIRSERVRDFQPPWRTVYVYRCPTCQKETRVRAGTFIGGRPTPSRGAIACPHCPDTRNQNLAAAQSMTEEQLYHELTSSPEAVQ